MVPDEPQAKSERLPVPLDAGGRRLPDPPAYPTVLLGRPQRCALRRAIFAFQKRGGEMPATELRQYTVRVWDLPTRLFHWLLAACVLFSIITAKIGGNALEWHFRSGYVVLTLLAFRLLWGLFGGHWSRFASFVRGPGTVWRYVRGKHRAGDRFDVGHNPLGALSVVAMLVFLAAQVATGLFADDEIANTGPLIKYVSSATSLQLTAYHKHIGQWVLITLIVLHIAAVLYYLVGQRRNLVGPMIHGDMAFVEHTPGAADNASSRALAVLLLALCAGAVTWLINLGG
jgi:cytochrome b